MLNKFQFKSFKKYANITFTSIESVVENDDVPTEKVPETRLENDEEKEQESIEVIEFFYWNSFFEF